MDSNLAKFLAITVVEIIYFIVRRCSRRRRAASGPIDGHTNRPDTDIPPVNRNAPKTVCLVPLSALDRATIELDSLAAPCRLRLLDCAAFLDADELRIIEYPPTLDATSLELSSSPLPSFAAISYPWRDLQLPPGVSVPSFTVSGATHADPISIDVIRTACLAARAFSRSYLWLDRLCILQTQGKDKSWQIQRMYRIYKRSDPCLVLPGGLVRLAGLSEPTTWIDRAWTLQEAAAPGEEKAHCIFSFTHPSYHAFLEERCDKEGYSDRVRTFLLNRKIHPLETVVEPGRSVTCKLDLLFRVMWGWEEWLRVVEPGLSERYDRSPVRIIYSPGASLLRRALLPSPTFIWASAYVRSSSRPVDMVFSIMDLLGVNLDVSQFGRDDRTKATIKLIQVMMRRGDPATWLFIAPWIPPSSELSTLPQMPETSVSGRAFIQTRRGRMLAFELVGEDETWRPEGAPRGEMTDSGYFVFSAKATLVTCDEPVVSGNRRKKAYECYNRERWAIVIGRLENLIRDLDSWKIVGTPPGQPIPAVGAIELTLMFVESHGYGLFHRVGMEHEIDERKTVGWDWKYREFQVGGPGRGERLRFDVLSSGPKFREVDNGIREKRQVLVHSRRVLKDIATT